MNPADLPSSPAAAGSPDGAADGGEAVAARNFQHYQVLRRADGTPWELGRGTMGITYKALDTNLRSEVALKVVNSTLINHVNARERFVREARAAAALRHRNVASVYHLGNDGEHFFYAMEFIDGETLDALVRRQGPLPVGTALRIALQAARALAAAARQKLVHRDIKPANLMVVHEDADEHMVVKVIDFGLARPTADEGEGSGAGSLTIHGFVGTPQYASPEQLEERTLDTRSDIYSLGVTLWFLLTGKPPFSGSLAGICNQHLSKPPPWESLPASVPEPARQLLAHMLEKDPAGRPQDAVELRREIEDCLAALHTPVPAPAAGDVPRAVPLGQLAKLFAGRNRPRDTAAVPAPGFPAKAAVPPRLAAPVVGPTSADAPEIGTLLSERYQLVALVGEGGGGRVFEARDLVDRSRVVAVKVLRAGFGGGSEDERERLRVEARQVMASPHPHLVEWLSFELPPVAKRTPAYVVEEWLSGFTLRDLLAARNGALPAIECLRLLGQAATAVDHAGSRRLERLEMGIHQLHLHFPPRAPVTDPLERRALLQMSMEEWPEWSLKIEPFSVSQDAGESGTWGGEVTLLPGLPLAAALRRGQEVPAPGTPGSGDPLTAAYLRSLARIAYELLGGQLPTPTGPAGRAAQAKYVSLPTLSEAGNAVLARALSDAPGFESAGKFFEALALASGFTADTLLPVPLRSLDPFPPVPVPVLPLVLVPPSASASTRGGVDSSAAQTFVHPVSVPIPELPPSTYGTSDTLPPAARETDINGLWDDSSVPRRVAADFPDEPDPWKESHVARLLEEEEASKLVDPHSTGFALAVGAMLGLVLLMAGFAVFVWTHEHKPAPATRPPGPMAGVRDPGSAGPPARKNPAGMHPGTTVAPTRPAPLATPPPLVSRRPTPPLMQPATAVQKAVSPSPAMAVAHPEPSAAVNDPPLLAVANSSPPPADATPGDATVASGIMPPVAGQPQPVVTAEGARSRPDPTPRFNDKVVHVKINSNPIGAEVFLQGALLGKTPLNIDLPPDNYQFVARYRDWPDEIRQDLRLTENQETASTDIRLMPPSQSPLYRRFSPVLESHQRRRRHDPSYPGGENIPTTATAVPVENIPVARAKPVVPAAVGPNSPEAASSEPPVRRALPVLEPFLKRESSAPQSGPVQAN